jgi:multiple sugar transport system substrate-binding protein
MCSFILFVTLNSYVWANEQKSTVTVAVLIFSVEQRNVFEEIATLFTQQNPNLHVRFISSDDRNYKVNSTKWLETPGNLDVLHWSWPVSLYQYASLGWVEPVTDIWLQSDINQNLSPSMKSLVSVGKQQFAIPYSSGFWGVYYRQSLFDKLNINVPNDWLSFLKVCQTLKDNNVIPLVIGTQNSWPSASWFDYLNLRINGLNFHQKVLRGEIPFHTEEMVKVFEHWKQLIDNGYFIKKAVELEFKQVVPLLYRNKAGMILSGNFISTQISPTIREDFKFFRFPIIDAKIPVVEEAPTDMFIIPAKSKNKAAAKRFLQFISQAHIQKKLNQTINFLPTNQAAEVGNDYFLRQGKKLLKQASSHSQYFDRNTPKAFSDIALRAFSQFIEDGDISKVLDKLETSRQEIFLNKH